jgi:putative transposase
MPYTYRRLTPSERDEAVEGRRQRGYPLHSPPHAYEEAGCFLITAACFEHAPIMVLGDRRTFLETRLLDELRAANVIVHGWVVLPNHYHVLVESVPLGLVPATIKHVHGTTSHQWNAADRLIGRRRVWYKYSDRMIRDEAHFYSALNYIHYNPAKHGYVESPYDWEWSSLSAYLDQRGKEWLREMWRLHAPGNMGKGWDDG